MTIKRKGGITFVKCGRWGCAFWRSRKRPVDATVAGVQALAVSLLVAAASLVLI